MARLPGRPISCALSACVIALGGAAAPAAAQVQWRHYRPTTTGILGDFVQAIHLDAQDRPWIAAYTPFWEEGGMSRMNEDGTWEVVSSFDHPQIGSPRFNDIVEDADGVMWIGTYDGLLRYEPAVGPPSLHLYWVGNSGLPRGRVYDVDLAPDGTLWAAVYHVTGSGGGLVRYDIAADAWQHWDTTNGLPWGLDWPGWDDVGHVAVLPDQSGPGYTVYFSSPHGLGVGTYRDGVFEWLGDPQNPPPGRYPRSLPGTDCVDELGNLWILTNQGLARRTPTGTEQVVGYPAGLGAEVSIVQAISGGRALLGTYYADIFLWDGGWSYLGNWGSGDHTYAFAEDSKGNFWVGGIGGSARYEDGHWQRYRVTNTGMLGFWIEAITFDPEGNVYFSANAGPGVGGFDMFDGERWTCVNDANYGLGPAWGLPSDNVNAMTWRARGTLALSPGSGQGLVEWDGKTYTYLLPQGWSVENVVEDRLERLWAPLYSDGVFLLDGAQQTRFTSSDSPLPAGPIGSIKVDRQRPGFVWITTYFGIAHTDGVTWNIYPRELIGFTQNTTSQMLSCAAPAPDGTLWIGSRGGLFHFNPATGVYVRYLPDNSALPSDEIHHVEITPDGHVWAATFDSTAPYPGGLTRFDGTTWTTYSAGSSPLPHNQIWELAWRPTPTGYELWVGTASEAVAVLDVATSAPCAADFDGDGGLGPADFTAFRAAFLAGEPRADFDGDGAHGPADFTAFRAAFLAGCP